MTGADVLSEQNPAYRDTAFFIRSYGVKELRSEELRIKSEELRIKSEELRVKN